MKLIHSLRGQWASPRVRVSEAAPTTGGALGDPADQPLRIVWTTPHGRTGKGGMDRLTQLVTSAIDDTGNGSIIITPLTTKGRWGKAVGAFIYLFALFHFILLVSTRGVHVLHINVAAYGSAYRKMILALVARLCGVPYIVHIHSGRFPEFWRTASPVIARAVQNCLEHSSAIIVLGREFEAMVLARLPTAQKRVRLLYNATPSRHVATDRPIAGAKLHLTTLGLLGPNKNTTQLIDALGRLKHRPDWMATIAGNGEVEKARAQVAKLGIADRVSVPGWLDQPAAQHLLTQTDIFLLPSLSEGIPMAILEAFSYGIPVIASAVNSIPELIKDGRNGLLVPVGDLEALVTAISRLLDDSELRHSLGRQAWLDHAAHYELNAYMERLQNVWRQAVLKPGLSTANMAGPKR